MVDEYQAGGHASYWLSALSGFCGLVMFYAWHRTGGTNNTPEARHQSLAARAKSVAPKWAPPDVLPVATAQQLLSRPVYAQLVRSIVSKSGLSSGNIESDLMPIVQAYASFVQLLPASESHHHAEPGGLLQHTLEVVDYSLTYRRSYMLPVGEGAERVNELKHVWTMAVILVAMFHDIGKPMSDQIITLYAHQGIGRDGKKWTPMAGTMFDQNATHYHVAFNPERRYEHHQELPVILMQRLVPARVLGWIGEQDSGLLSMIVQSLGPGADAKSILVEITRRADQESTRVNLLSGPRTRFASARETPLVEVLDEALRRLLLSGRLRLNVPGGHGFIDGDDLLLVVPRTLDEVRRFLSESLVPGSRGIPQDNLIVYSTWMDFGRIASMPGEAKGDGLGSSPKAVWRVNIEGIPSALTVLRFPRSSQTLQGFEVNWPGVYPGQINVVEANFEAHVDAAAKQPRDVSEGPSMEQLQPTEGKSVNSVPSDAASRAPATTEQPDLPSFLLEMEEGGAITPGVPNSAALMAQEQQAIQQLSDAGGLVLPKHEESSSTQSILGLLKDATMLNLSMGGPPLSTARSAPTTKKAVPTMKIKEPGSGASARAKSEQLEQFEDWLRLGLQSGHVPYNSGQAMIHFHQVTDPETGQTRRVALLITPAIYQRFAKECDPALAQTALADVPRAVWLPLQSALLKAHAHRKEQVGKIAKSIFRFATKGGGVFGANVLTAPEKIFGVVPEPNPYITGEVKESSLVANKAHRLSN